jgi:hypothetical protein
MVMPGVKATPEDITKSLEGNWRDELLFVLREHLELYRLYPEKITDCDRQLRKHLESLGSKVDPPMQPLGPRPKGKKIARNAPQFDLRSELYRMSGIEWAQINSQTRNRFSHALCLHNILVFLPLLRNVRIQRLRLRVQTHLFIDFFQLFFHLFQPLELGQFPT